MKIAEQQISAVIDPSLTTVSSFRCRGARPEFDHRGREWRHIRPDRALRCPFRVAADRRRRMDMLGNSTGDKMAMSQTMADGSPNETGRSST